MQAQEPEKVSWQPAALGKKEALIEDWADCFVMSPAVVIPPVAVSTAKIKHLSLRLVLVFAIILALALELNFTLLFDATFEAYIQSNS